MDCIFLIKFTGVNLNENRRQLVDAETSIQAGIIENQHLVQMGRVSFKFKFTVLDKELKNK